MRARSKPFLRGAIAITVVLAAMLATSRLAAAHPAGSMAALDQQVFAAINTFRVEHHLAPLQASPELAHSAGAHSLQMARLGYFAHHSANGTAFWRRIAHWYGSQHYAYWSVGENLLWAAPSISAATAMKMWIASPEHLKNLLDPHWRRLGVAAVHVAHAPGVYHGLPVTIITTDFGVRS